MHILINDFIGGALDRGIPLYVRNLIEGLREQGLRVSVVRAPAFCRKLPRSLLYAIAVVVEQAALPVIGLWRRADFTIYPYNSVAVVDLLTKRGRIVVHDLEQLNRPRSPSRAYYLACYRALKRRNAPVFTISEISQLRLIRSQLFGFGLVTILPNTFYEFERLLGAEQPERKPAILLCTGSTANKDLETVVARYLPRALTLRYRISILGLHKKSDMARLAPLNNFIGSGQLRVCGLLSDREVAREYASHSVVWVHSLREGFGRGVVEGRLAGSRVIASDIPEFAGLRDDHVHFYKEPAEFMTILERVIEEETPAPPYKGYPYRALLSEALRQGLQITTARSEERAPQATPARSDTDSKIPQQSQNP